MKRKILFLIAVMAMVACFMALGASAATTNEFGEPEEIPNINLTEMNTDTVARVVIMAGENEFHTYPACYIVSNNTKFQYNFKPINDALGTSYNKHSVIRIEVPDNITIAANCGDLSQTNNLLEIKFSPTSELHTLEYGCFYANKKLQKLNIPKKVTTIGTLIINNSTLEELVFDDGFCAVLPKDSFRGAIGLKKMVFSNQMTTMEDRAFDSTLGESLQEFYMGASLLDLGTNNISYVKQSVKYYVPAQFLSQVDKITMETFSWWSSSACLPTGVIFFTGTEEQAAALIAKSTYDRVFCSTAELVKWNSDIDDNEYVPQKGWRIVYDYGVCNAFYGGEHQMTGDVTANVVDFFTEIKVGDLCTREGCGVGTTEKVIAPIFENLGFSTSEMPDMTGKSSITLGYKINYDAYEEYSEYGTFEFGLVLSAVEVVGNEPLVIENGQVVKANQRVLTVKQSELICDYVDFKLIGIDPSFNGKELIMSMYTYNGREIDYLNENVTIQVK